MKNIFRLLSIIFLLSTVQIFAQAPQSIRYQGVASIVGEPIQNEEIVVRLSIIESDPTGNISYQEVHTLVTDASGYFSLSIGEGDNGGSSLADVGWLDADHFLSVEFDTAGNNNFNLIGIEKFYSVPYTLYTNEAKYGPKGDFGSQGLKGPKGDVGQMGMRGSNGQPGAIGPQGPIGSPGVDGAQGPPGLMGAPGPNGYNGPDGATGPQGFQGLPNGLDGPEGNPGAKGDDGPIGEDGDSGEIGAIGIDGIGPQGPDGPQGIPGLPSNILGPNGPQGEDGPQGKKGDSFAGGPGPTGTLIQELLNLPPDNPIDNRIYLDDGTNRVDGQIGFRLWSGTNWIDL